MMSNECRIISSRFNQIKRIISKYSLMCEVLTNIWERVSLSQTKFISMFRTVPTRPLWNSAHLLYIGRVLDAKFENSTHRDRAAIEKSESCI